jgi:hypothetical protein
MSSPAPHLAYPSSPPPRRSTWRQDARPWLRWQAINIRPDGTVVLHAPAQPDMHVPADSWPAGWTRLTGLPVHDELARILSCTVDPDSYPPALHWDDQAFEMVAHVANGHMTVNEMTAYPTGTGLGATVMDALRTYVDQRHLTLVVHDVTSPAFFDRFSWLTAQPTGEHRYDRAVIDYRYHAA